jgi:hypothetical protein
MRERSDAAKAKVWPRKRNIIVRTRQLLQHDTKKPKPNTRPRHGTLGKSHATLSGKARKSVVCYCGPKVMDWPHL